MFLEMLNDEQKKLFLHLAVLAANANNIVEDAERDMLIHFAREMIIDPIISSDKQVDEITDALRQISGNTERKVILFELVGIMFSDTQCDEMETAFLNEVATKLSVSNADISKMIGLVKDYIDLYNKIFDTVIRE